MNDMHQTIVPKSDQLNADDLIGRELTIKITGVEIRGGQDQPVSIHFEGDQGKPYKACKSMCRIIVSAWGPDSSKYVGRSMTLYRDPKVKWGGMEVGGIRISHMSDIADDMTMALTVTRANKKPFTVRPIPSGGKKLGAESSAPGIENPAGNAEFITADQVADLETLCQDAGTTVAKLKAAAKVERLSQIRAADHSKALNWLDAVKKARETAPSAD